MWRLHTPRGRVTSLANRRSRSEPWPVHGSSSASDRSSSAAMWGRTLSQAHSRTAKCESSANGRISSSRFSSVHEFGAPTAIAAHPRTVSLLDTEACASAVSPPPSKRTRPPARICLTSPIPRNSPARCESSGNCDTSRFPMSMAICSMWFTDGSPSSSAATIAAGTSDGRLAPRRIVCVNICRTMPPTSAARWTSTRGDRIDDNHGVTPRCPCTPLSLHSLFR